MQALGPFWIIGIVVNLTLTGLAAWWVIRMMRPRKPPQEEGSAAAKPGGDS